MTDTRYKVHGPTASASMEADGQPARFTRVTSTFPAEVSKLFELKDGALVKTLSAHISSGHVEVVGCVDLRSFAEQLTALGASQCLVYGLPPKSPMRLMSDGAWTKAGRPMDAISRTEKNFRWPSGAPGILMLDHDPQPGMPEYTPDELVRLVRHAVPALAHVDMLAWPSASSLIYDKRTGDCLAPMRGCRIYLMVDDATVIPALGKHIVDALWSQDHGVFVVSRSGRLLERGLFDTSVWQANRIDFAAGAVCREPLEQRRGPPLLFGGEMRMACTVDADGDSGAPVFTLTGPQLERAKANKALARKAVESEASVVTRRYADQRMREIELVGRSNGLSVEAAGHRARSAVYAMLRAESPELHGDVMVTVVRENGGRSEVSVREILSRRTDFDGVKTLDPVEPEYHGSHVVGKLFLRGPVPRLHSFAHGAATYKLVSQHGTVEVFPGSLSRTVDQTCEVLRACGDLYDHGDAFVTVGADGRMMALTSGLVPYVLSARVAYCSETKDRRTGDMGRKEMDPPPAVAKSIYEFGRGRRLPQLNAVITAPIIVGRRLIDQDGYDAESGLLLIRSGEGGDWNRHPAVEDVRKALVQLLAMFDSFPFDTEADRGAFLAALFTAVMRPGLRTSPGFAFDAPAQGTGKSLLTDCVAIIGTGTAPIALPHLHDDESEVRKRLVALLLNGVPVMIWDNVKGTFDSAVLASLLTSEHLSDRLLGESRQLFLPNRMLALFNGNNMTLRGELTRRIVPCRLDAGMERPYLRKFTSSPRDVCLKERQTVVERVLTVVRGYQLHGDGFASEFTLGSFEEWSDAVLRPILWAASVSGDLRVGNPLDKIAASEDDDEELMTLTRLHRRWHARHGDSPMTIRDLLDETSGDFSDQRGEQTETLRECVLELVGERRAGSPAELATALGKQLAYRQGRIFDGNRRFVKASQSASGGVARWCAATVTR